MGKDDKPITIGTTSVAPSNSDPLSPLQHLPKKKLNRIKEIKRKDVVITMPNGRVEERSETTIRFKK